MDIQDPVITEIEKTGYPNMVAQPEHNGTDINGNEILTGDSIVLLPNGETILEENLEDYLIEELGFQFITAI